MEQQKANGLACGLAEIRESPYAGGHYQPQITLGAKGAYTVALRPHRMEQPRLLELIALAAHYGAQITISEYGVTFA